MEYDILLYEQPRKPKFENDFIMFSEFSELVGPVPLCFIPDERAKGHFNASQFAVRIMSSDFQTASGKVVAEDTQIFLSEKQDCAYAYVHYFSLNDNKARGYIRQYCLSYISTCSNKIADNFDQLLKQFSQVTAMLKVSNHVMFQRDMNCHLADLELTMSLLKTEGWMESNTDPNQLYLEFDFAKEDVPERDPSQVARDMEETREILASIQTEMDKEDVKQVLEDLKKLRQVRKKKNRERASTFPQDLTRDGSVSGNFTSYLPLSPDSGTRTSSESLSLSSCDSIEYQPQRVMTHLVHKFERRLRTLEELAPRACAIAMDRLHEIHKFFSRSELALEMEKEEKLLLEPQSSLLTIGRVPVLNFMQGYLQRPQAPPFPFNDPSHRQSVSSFISEFSYQATPYRISAKNTWGMPNQLAENSMESADCPRECKFDTSFLDDKLGLKQLPLYIDPVYCPNQWPYPESPAPEQPDCEYGLTLSSSTYRDSDTNLLSVSAQQDDEDGISGASTTFATPETGLTPKSSDEEESALKNEAPTGMALESGRGVGGHGVGVATFLNVPGSHTGSLERSGDSHIHLHSESGSQCTLTDESRESSRPAPPPHLAMSIGTGTQVQITGSGGQTGNTGRERQSLSPPSSDNSVEMVDGAARVKYPLMPHHIISINSLESQNSREIVTFEPYSNGCTSDRRVDPVPAGTEGQVVWEEEEGVAGIALLQKEQYENPLNEGQRQGSPSVLESQRQQASPFSQQQGDPLVARQGSPQVARQGSPLVARQGSPLVARQGSPLVARHGGPWDHRQGSPLMADNQQRQGSPNQQQGNVQGSPLGHRHGSPLVPEGQRQGSPLVPEGQRQGSPLVPEGQRQGSPLVPEGQRQGSPLVPEGQRQGSPLVPEGQRQGSPLVAEHQRQGSPLVPEGQRQGSPLVAEHQRQGSPLVPEGQQQGLLVAEQQRQGSSLGARLASIGQHHTISVPQQEVSPLRRAQHSPADSTGASTTSDELLMGRTSTTTSDELPIPIPRSRLASGGVVNKDTPEHLYFGKETVSPDVYHTPATISPHKFGFPSKPGQQHRYLHREDIRHPQPFSSPLSPSNASVSSLASVTSMGTVFSQNDRSLQGRGATVLENAGLPLVSTVDHIEGHFKFKPGKGIINFCKNTPIVTDLLYCLLQGRPLVLLGKQADENLIRRLIRVLWLFVPGHSSQRQVITWQETPLEVRDLSRVKLLGLCSKTAHPIGAHLKPYVSYWDCNTGKLWTPPYNGEILKPIVSRTKDKKNEEVFLTHIHSVFLEIAMKAFVYYHGYCTSMNSTRRSLSFETSSRKYHNAVTEDKAAIKKKKMAFMDRLKIGSSDLDIIEYFVDVIREQQLIECGKEDSNGGPFDQDPVRVHLQTKHCADSFCKPKRPY